MSYTNTKADIYTWMSTLELLKEEAVGISEGVAAEKAIKDVLRTYVVKAWSSNKRQSKPLDTPIHDTHICVVSLREQILIRDRKAN